MKIKTVFKDQNKPKLTGKKCIECGTPLNEYHAFFGKDKCSQCSPIYLMSKNKKDELPTAGTGK